MPTKTIEEIIKQRNAIQEESRLKLAALEEDSKKAMRAQVEAIKAAYKNLKDLGFTSDARLFDEFEDKENTKATTTLKAIDKYIREELDFVRTRNKDKNGAQGPTPVVATTKRKKAA